MQIDESNIIKLLQNNVNEAYFYLYKRLYAPLCSFALYYVHDRETVDDIVQELFVSLLTTKKEFTDYQELKFYLYKAVKNKSINHIRHQTIKEDFSNELLKFHDENDLFYSRMLEEDIYSNLVSAIENLPPKCKSVMQLTMEGYKIIEIADKLSISSEMVKEHKSLAKNKLRATLKSIDKIYIIIMLWIISNLQ